MDNRLKFNKQLAFCYKTMFTGFGFSIKNVQKKSLFKVLYLHNFISYSYYKEGVRNVSERLNSITKFQFILPCLGNKEIQEVFFLGPAILSWQQAATGVSLVISVICLAL